jgi:hypothetical protein
MVTFLESPGSTRRQSVEQLHGERKRGAKAARGGLGNQAMGAGRFRGFFKK